MQMQVCLHTTTTTTAATITQNLVPIAYCSLCVPRQDQLAFDSWHCSGRDKEWSFLHSDFGAHFVVLAVAVAVAAAAAAFVAASHAGHAAPHHWRDVAASSRSQGDA